MRKARIAVALLSAATLAAASGCGRGKENPGEASVPAHEKKLNLYIWSSYMPGPNEILSPLGAGRMGEVYRARIQGFES